VLRTGVRCPPPPGRARVGGREAPGRVRAGDAKLVR